MKDIMAYVTPNQTAETVTKFLYQDYILIFRTIARLLSDHGANFTCSIIDEMCNLLRVRKLWTMPYHPQMREVILNHCAKDSEAGRGQKGQLARTSG